MSLHLIKLCVGCDSVADLEDWIREKLKEKKRRRQKPEHIHTTRMVPKRGEELIDGGSLYWVVRGQIACRERILDIRPFTDKDGVGRCRIVLDGKVVLVEPRPRAAFQGWRYLEAKDAPAGSLARGAWCCENARNNAARVTRVRPSLNGDVVNQACFAKPCSDEQANRPFLERHDGRQRQCVARL